MPFKPWPIFVSCSLRILGHAGNSGMEDLQGNACGDMGLLVQHAAALAEKKVGMIIIEKRMQFMGSKWIIHHAHTSIQVLVLGCMPLRTPAMLQVECIFNLTTSKNLSRRENT